MADKIEVFYTGGGITLAEVDIDTKHYAVVSSDAPEFFSIYAHEDGEKDYTNMVSSTSKEDIAQEFRALYTEMLDKLKTA